MDDEDDDDLQRLCLAITVVAVVVVVVVVVVIDGFVSTRLAAGISSSDNEFSSLCETGTLSRVSILMSSLSISAVSSISALCSLPIDGLFFVPPFVVLFDFWFSDSNESLNSVRFSSSSSSSSPSSFILFSSDDDIDDEVFVNSDVFFSEFSLLVVVVAVVVVVSILLFEIEVDVTASTPSRLSASSSSFSLLLCL